MTSQQLQIAVAEKMGWKSDTGFMLYDGTKLPFIVWRLNGGPTVNPDKVPPYSTSIDAIQAAADEKFKLYAHRLLFEHRLSLLTSVEDGIAIWELTAADWCEAFLETCKEIEK